MKQQVLEYKAWKMPDDGVPMSMGIDLVEGPEAIRQSIVMLLSTVPGERVMRPDYGCALNELVFAPNDDTTAGLAIHYVREAIVQWEPRVEILKLDAGPFPDRPDLLFIELEYRIRITGESDQVQFQVELEGGAS